MIQQTGVTFKQILQGFIGLIILIALVWVAFYALIVVLVLGMFAAAFFFIRRFLIKQGIINTPEAMEKDEFTATTTVIETEYHDVTTPRKKDDNDAG